MYGGHAESATGGFGGEERFENQLLCCLIHTAACIAYFEASVCSSLDDGAKRICFGSVFLKNHIGEHHPDFTVNITDSLDRVDDKVHDYLLYLAGVAVNFGNITFQVKHYGDILLDGGLQHLDDFIDQKA